MKQRMLPLALALATLLIGLDSAGSALAQSLEFTGGPKYLQTPDSPLLDLTASFSLEAWALGYPHPAGYPYPGHNAILAKGNDTESYGVRFAIGDARGPAYWTPHGQINWHLPPNWQDPGAARQVEVRSPTALPHGQWHHIVMTKSPTELRLYVDGALVDTTASTWDAIPTDEPFYIGVNFPGGDDYFSGCVDEVRIWGGTLAPEEIRAHWATPSSVHAVAPLVAHWNFDEGSGQTAFDQSGNGLDLQLGSSPAPDSNDPAWTSHQPRPSAEGRNLAYVANGGAGSVTVFDTDTNLRFGDDIPVGDLPVGIAVTADGRRVFVGNESSNSVSVIDTDTWTVETVSGVPSARDVAITPDGSRVYVASNCSGCETLTVIDGLPPHGILGVIDVGGQAQGLEVEPVSGDFLLVAMPKQDRIVKVDTDPASPTFETVVESIAFGLGSSCCGPTRLDFTADGGTAFVTNNLPRYLSSVDVASGQATNIFVGDFPFDVAAQPNRDRAYATAHQANGLAVIDTDANILLRTIASGGTEPNSLAFHPDGSRLYVVTRLSNRVSVLDTDSASSTFEQVIAQVPVGSLPGGIALPRGAADEDGDGVPDDEDICPGGNDNVDTDQDGVPDHCDPCPVDPENDSDGDGVCDSDDLCLGDDTTGDADADGVCDDVDPCLGSPNEDADGDGVCDGDDVCTGDDATGDSDGDGVCDNIDVCLGDDAAGDFDTDGVCDDVDVCPLDPENDADGDGFCESDDNCPFNSNSDQNDLDEDGFGDACDEDDDGDDIPDGNDNCPFDFNPGQEDFDGDGAGDFCDDDDDEDGVQDDEDECSYTEIGDPVAGNGCSIAQLCPCESVWKNHGAYVRCVAHTSEVFVDLGLISEDEKDAIVSEAAQSDCGHKR